MSDQDQGQTRRMPVPDPGEAETPAAVDELAPADTPAAVDEPAPADTPAPVEQPPIITQSAAEAAPPIQSVPPPATRGRDTDHGRTASILFGLVILGFGLWFFAEYTLGYDLPNIRWSQLWPVLLIVIGVWVVLGSMRRGSR
jgi:hypothetical protein